MNDTFSIVNNKMFIAVARLRNHALPARQNAHAEDQRMNLYSGPKLGANYKRGLVDRDGRDTWIGVTVMVGMLVFLGTAFFWLPLLLVAVGYAIGLALPAMFLFCVVGALVGFAKRRRVESESASPPTRP